jgi:hypothetical protein
MRHSQRHPAADQEIQKWVARQRGVTPQRARIAHCKELSGMAAASADWRQDCQRCPTEKQPTIKQAFRYFGRLNETK